MSLENKVKDTTNKLIEKYSKTSWDYMMNPLLNTPEFRIALTQLMTEHSQGVKFTPSFGNLFGSFDLCKLDDLKVVIINDAPNQDGSSDGLAFSNGNPNPFTRMISQITNVPIDGTSLKYLPGQEGVLLLNASITASIGNPSAHEDLWTKFMSAVVHQLGYKKTGIIYVFVGEKTEHLSKNVRNGHYKFFLPSWKNDKDGWDCNGVFENINNILEKINKVPVVW